MRGLLFMLLLLAATKLNAQVSFETHFKLLQNITIDSGVTLTIDEPTTIDLSKPTKVIPVSYTHLDVYKRQGRMHQLRRHFAHIFHPINGDRKHGCNKQNKFFKEQFEMTTMLLHASELAFKHPVTEIELKLSANLHNEFKRVMKLMNFTS